MSTLAQDGVLPRSRVTDPTTSLDAGRDADLSDSQREVLAIFYRRPKGLADHQLVAVARSSGTIFTPQRIRSARAELVEAKRLVLIEGEYRKTKTGRRARVFTVAEGM